jgi:hypothetical protein
MSYVNIKVTAYSGYQDNESPRAFLMNDETMTVVEILDMWIEEGFSDRMRKRFFIIKTDNNQNYKIYLDEKTPQWFCEIK